MNSANNSREIIFIDAAVTDWKTLTAGLSPDIPVVLLPAQGNGLAAMAEALAGYGILDAIHLVSHGATGRLTLGDIQLTSANMAEQNDVLATISQHLSPYSDLLLYGCSVAQGEIGQAFVEALASRLNGVDIAASVDRTGPLSLGGDWDLEYTTGQIETVLPFTVQGMEGIDECLGCVFTNGHSTTTTITPGDCKSSSGSTPTVSSIALT